MEECRDFIALSDKANHPIVLFDMLERYGKRPFGWPDDEVLILVASLLVLGEIQLMMNGASITIDKVFENITAPRKQRSITVVKRKMVRQPSRKFQSWQRCLPKWGQTVKMACSSSERAEWQSSLSNYKSLADTGSYPGEKEITDGLSLLKAIGSR